jgi:hypothetical protein
VKSGTAKDRAKAAARMLLNCTYDRGPAYSTAGRDLDDCFEMGDGDRVAAEGIQIMRGNSVLGDRLRCALREGAPARRYAPTAWIEEADRILEDDRQDREACARLEAPSVHSCDRCPPAPCPCVYDEWADAEARRRWPGEAGRGIGLSVSTARREALIYITEGPRWYEDNIAGRGPTWPDAFADFDRRTAAASVPA